MKLPISRRLIACADLVPPCHTAADVGTDHGYLAIRLLQEGRCARVIASDLREQPLATARANAHRFGTADRMDFIQSDGLHNLKPGSFQVLILAGMGGDLMTRILADAPWLDDPAYTLILQPQSAANDLRRWLGEHRFGIEQERLILERTVAGISQSLDPADLARAPYFREALAELLALPDGKEE